MIFFVFGKDTNKIFLKLHLKKTHFSTKSSEIIISFRRAGSTLQKRSLLYIAQKLKANEKKYHFFYFFLISLMMLDFVIQALYDIRIKTNKFRIARMKYKDTTHARIHDNFFLTIFSTGTFY
jgi:hypothetical protein